MEQPQSQPKQDKRIQNWLDFENIKGSNGWLIYERELDELIKLYDGYMDNDNIDGSTLKNLQLIRRGLKMARAIPKKLETEAKTAKKGAPHG
jgi:hypothetical protein